MKPLTVSKKGSFVLKFVGMTTLLKRIKVRTSVNKDINIEAAQNFIKSNIEFKGANIWILIFAIAVASVGLNVNSIPVVIGAMLISPLMGPIMGIGMALGINDSYLLKRSFGNLLVMTVASIMVSAIYFFVSPLDLDNPTELLARTNPTMYDVLIALFGGFAVIMAVCLKEKGSIIAGAAIATALMPPLCTAGYGLANGSVTFFLGAIYLYLINSIFIALATFITVRYLHFPMVRIADEAKQKRVHRIMTICTIILIIPSVYTAVIMIKENRFNQNAKEFVAANKNFDNSYIYDYSIKHTAGKQSVLTISVAGEPLSTRERSHLYEQLDKFNIGKEQLRINQTTTAVKDNSSSKEVVQTIFEQSEQEISKTETTILQLESELSRYKSKEFPIKQIAKEIAAQYPNLVSLSLSTGSFCKGDDVHEETIAIVKFSNRLSQEQLSRLKIWLAVRLDVKDLRVIAE